MGVPQTALEAVAADDVAFRRDQVTDRQKPGGSGLGTELGDLSGEFVPHDDRQLEAVARPAVPLPDVQIGSADARVVDPDQRFAAAADGHRHFPQDDTGTGGFLD
jgi:hypothetical protein